MTAETAVISNTLFTVGVELLGLSAVMLNFAYMRSAKDASVRELHQGAMVVALGGMIAVGMGWLV